MRDFSLDKYRELCKTLIENDYEIITFRDYLSKEHRSKFIILRHDVDSKPERALRMAKIENKLDIKTSYYFRTKRSVFNLNIIKSIHGMGHEIGYHYEVLSTTRGNYLKAIKLFEKELSDFRKFIEIETICMHGSPLSRYDNRDLWKSYDFRSFGIKGEAYLSTRKDLDYFSDTGWNWDKKNKLRDIMANNNFEGEIDTTDSLLNYLENETTKNIYILVHPENWTGNSYEWYYAFGENKMKNLAKSLLKIWYNRNLKIK